MRHDAGGAVHCPQVEPILLDLKTVGVQLSASLQDLQVTITLDVQVLEDKEDDLVKKCMLNVYSPWPMRQIHLLLVDFVVNGSLHSLLKVTVKPGEG